MADEPDRPAEPPEGAPTIPGGTPSEAALRAQELEFIFDCIPSPVVVYDAQGVPVRANPAAVEVYGLDPTTVDRIEVAERFRVRHPDGRRVSSEELPTTRALHGELVRSERYLFTNARGEECVILSSVSPLWSGRQVTGAVAVWHDITEREQLVDQMEEQRSLLEAVFQQMPAGVIVSDPSGRIVRENAQAGEVRRQAGLTGGPLERTEEFPLLRADGQPLDPQEYPLRRAVSRGEATLAEELKYRRADGDWGVLAISAAPVRDSQGRIVLGVVIFADVAEQVRARARLAEAEAEQARQAQLLETVLENVQSGVAYLDREFRYLLVNPMYGSLVRHSREELLGRRPADFHDLPQLQAFFEYVRDTGEPVRKEEFALQVPERPERGVTYWNGAVVPVKDQQGSVYGLVFSLLEVTDQVRAREQMLAAERARTQMAEQLSREISHRVKNTLAIVAGMLQVQMGHTELGAAGRMLMRDAISRIRTFAVLHEQASQRQREDVELVDALRRIAEIDRAAAAGVAVAVSVEGEPVSCPFGCATNLSVVANELVTNAMKYGAPDATGTVRVKVKVARRDGLLTLSVWNSGNPIAAAASLLGSARGGLSLVKAVAEHYQGSFTLRRHRGGTRAEVAVPVELVQREA